MFLQHDSMMPRSIILRLAALFLGSIAWSCCAEPPAAGHDQAVFPEDPAIPTTGRVLSRAEVRAMDPRAVLGDSVYAEVNSKWLAGFYDDFRTELYHNGILKWDARFTCRHFAAYYAALAQARFYRGTFHGTEKANALALGTVWFARSDGSGHALIVAFTERGRVFIEPQTGKEVKLASADQHRAFLEVF